MNDQELRAVAFLALRVREQTSGAGKWDEAGLMSNLRKLQNRNLHMTVEHVLRHAADPAAKTPGVLAGAFTPPAPSGHQPWRPPKKDEACYVCGHHLDRCICGEQATRPPRAADADARLAALAAARAAVRDASA